MTINNELLKDDLYHAVNGEWLETAVIPDDQPSTGGFMNLHNDVEKLLMADVAEMSAGSIELTNPEQGEFIKFYGKANDIEARNHLGHSPIQTDLQQIKALNSIADLQAIAKDWVLKSYPLPFKLSISPDLKNTERYALDMDVPSKILPDTTYYGEDNETGQQLLAVYSQMSQQVLELMGFSKEETAQFVEKAIQFDALFIPHLKSSEELADYTKSYNPRSPEEVANYSDAFDFLQLFKELIGEDVDQIIVTEPKFFEAFVDIVNAENFDKLKAWLLVKLANSLTPYLSEELRQAGSLYQLTLSGNPKTQSAEKHAYYLAIGIFDQVIGDYYGKKYFGAEARDDVREMVEAMIGIYEDRLRKNDWLSAETIDLAIEKLESLDILVGYPDNYPEIYTQLKVAESESFFENFIQFVVQFNERDFARWNEEVDHTEWHMSAAMVNAYYSPDSNLICFPAAILQAPFYSIEQSRSENYGGIGAVIAHEISHAFDNNGSKFDAQGNLNDWWTENDLTVFEERAQAMIKQWDGIDFAGGKVNGTLTVSENIADGGGLNAALQATKLEDDANLAEFFMNWARIWSMKARPEYQQLLLAVDVHSPNELRANIQPRNLDEFYTTFDIQPGDGMYMKPEDRIVIW